MTIVITPQTQKLLDVQMMNGSFSTPDDAVRFALEALDQVRGDDIEDLDHQTQESLQRAFAQSADGEGRPWEEVKQEWQKKFIQK